MTTKINSAQSLFRRFLHFVELLLLKTVRFSYNGNSRGIVKNSDNYHFCEPDNRFPALIHIMARPDYSEFQRSYPVTELAELKLLLNQEYHGQQVFHLFSTESLRQRSVTSFVLNKTEEVKNTGLRFLLPESLLIHYSVNEKPLTYMVKTEAVSWFIYSGQDTFSSQLQTSFCSNSDVFKAAHGVPEEVAVKSLSNQLKADYLVAGLKKLSLQQLFSFIVFKFPEIEPARLKKFAVSAMVIVVGYLAAGQLYLASSAKKYESEFEQISVDAEKLLAAQSEYEHLVENYKVAGNHLSSQQSFLPVLALLLELAEQKIQIVDTVWESPVLIIRGRVPQATTLLQQIQKKSAVKTAEFADPITRSDNLDRFSIRILFTRESTDDAN